MTDTRRKWLSNLRPVELLIEGFSLAPPAIFSVVGVSESLGIVLQEADKKRRLEAIQTPRV